METLSFSVGDETIDLYRCHHSYHDDDPPPDNSTSIENKRNAGHTAEESFNEEDEHDNDGLPFFTVTNTDRQTSEVYHEILETAFQDMFGGPTVQLELTTNGPETSCSHYYVKEFLKAKLLCATFGQHQQGIKSIECHVSCARVTVGGFGAQWHHDATSHLTFKVDEDTIVCCDYLALYYLEPCHEDGNHWLECALDKTHASISNFLAASTASHGLLVLRNDLILHRTPFLSNLIPGGVRRFFYMPFRVMDWNNQPMFLQTPLDASWTTCEMNDTMKQKILFELKKNDKSLDLDDYVIGKIWGDTGSGLPDQLNSLFYNELSDY